MKKLTAKFNIVSDLSFTGNVFAAVKELHNDLSAAYDVVLFNVDIASCNQDGHTFTGEIHIVGDDLEPLYDAGDKMFLLFDPTGFYQS
jgi:hypothetical protein